MIVDNKKGYECNSCSPLFKFIRLQYDFIQINSSHTNISSIDNQETITITKANSYKIQEWIKTVYNVE